MFELKPISYASIPEALSKAERYRLLNESALAESICLDILRVDPGNQKALVMLLLARSDQFGQQVAVQSAREIVYQLTDHYERAYYAGLVSERFALAKIRSAAPMSGYEAYEALRDAMRHFEEAEAIRPPGNDDAILRWNTCARLLMANSSLMPRPQEAEEVVLDD